MRPAAPGGYPRGVMEKVVTAAFEAILKKSGAIGSKIGVPMRGCNRVLCLIACCIASTAYASAITSVMVRAPGEGSTLQQAINDGLLTAVEQVDGRAVSEADLSATMQISLSADQQNNAEYLGSQAYIHVVMQVTHQAVMGFKVTSYKQNPNGSWTVNLAVTVTKYERPGNANLTRIVVAPFHTSSDDYWMFGAHVPARKVATDLADKLQSYLIDTNKFTVLDRNNDAVVTQELSLANSSAAATNEYALVGQKLVADYILVGSIESLNYHEVSTYSLTGEHIYSHPTGGMLLKYQLINTATQQIELSNEVSVSLSELPRDAGGSAQRALDRSVAVAVNQEGSAILHWLYPLRIVAVDGVQLIIAAGRDIVTPGQIYKVVGYGKEIIDPDTHEPLGKIESYCCEVKIDRVEDKMSYGTLVPPTKELIDFSPEKYILGSLVQSKTRKNHRSSENSMKALEKEIQQQQQQNSPPSVSRFF